jgi:hypothetical protein
MMIEEKQCINEKLDEWGIAQTRRLKESDVRRMERKLRKDYKKAKTITQDLLNSLSTKTA